LEATDMTTLATLIAREEKLVAKLERLREKIATERESASERVAKRAAKQARLAAKPPPPPKTRDVTPVPHVVKPPLVRLKPVQVKAKIREIVTAVSEAATQHFKRPISEEAILSHGQTRRLWAARTVVYHLAMQIGETTLSEVAQSLNRCVSTLHQQIDRELDADESAIKRIVESARLSRNARPNPQQETPCRNTPTTEAAAHT
jgi:hypothetical protein